MLTTVTAGPYTIRGLSVAGIQTSLFVRELGVLFDVGIAARSCAGAENVFLSHGHADHCGALVSLLGMRGLMRLPPPRLFLPAEIADSIREALQLFSRAQRYEFTIQTEALLPGDERELRPDLSVRAFRTHHTGPSLGYQFFSRVPKLKPEYLGLPGKEIARRRQQGDDLFDHDERLELAYATDTLLHVVETTPSLLRTRVLILECSFLDERKAVSASRSGGHVHLDELLEKASAFQNEALVLMHFSQMYSPADVHAILKRRCPPELWRRIVVMAPSSGPWPG
ncbi:MAG TPA: MBL fold metallo-hydrolase [Polyangiaceae bacterium]|jgi:ribonuclease Z|nr:MBL fold metallo-hydrolase [Polyangiaceae bacterium]